MKQLYSFGLILAFITACISSLSAQTFQKDVLSKASGKANVFELRQAFDAWAAGQDLTRTRGWKPLRRFLEIEATRVQNDGTYPDRRVFLQALQQVDVLQQQNLNRSGSVWTPEGPEVVPPSKSGNSNSGVGRLNCVAFHPTDPNILFVGAPEGGIWKTVNHGQSWIPLGDNLPVPGVSSILIHPQNPDIIYIATGDSEYGWGDTEVSYGGSHGWVAGVGVLKSVDGGQTWLPTGLSFDALTFMTSVLNTLLLDPAAPDHLLASGAQGVYQSFDGGDNWEKTLDGPVDMLEQDPANPQVVYAAESDDFQPNPYGKPVILRSDDFGSTWTVLEPFAPNENAQRLRIRVAPSNSNVLYVVAGNSGTSGLYKVLRSADAGATWQTVLNGATRNLLGWNLGIGPDDNGGQAWYDLTLMVDPLDADRVFVGGVNMWGSADGGQTWALVTHSSTKFGPSLHADHHRMTYNPLNHRFYQLSDGGIKSADQLLLSDMVALEQCVDTSNFGATPSGCYLFPTVWTDISGGLAISQFYRFDVFDGDPAYMLGGTQDNSHPYRDNGVWNIIFGGDGMDAFIHPTNPHIVYGASQNGYLKVSLDGGASHDNLSEGLPGDVGRSWITPFEPSLASDTVVFGGYNQIWKHTPSTDWTQYSSFIIPSWPSRDLATTPANPQALAVLRAKDGSNQRQIMLTKDDGQTWQKITTNFGGITQAYPSDICFGNNDNEVYLAQAGFDEGYKVWRTLDGGISWQNISKDLPNIPVICVVQHFGSPNHLTYIGTDFGVFFTTDDMAGWEAYNLGLPRVRVSDIDLHYQSGKIFVATFGRGIWSNDFTTVGSTEPAIYQAGLTVAPNPNAGAFTVQLDRLEPGDYQMMVVDVLGRRLMQRTIQADSPKMSLSLELNAPAGLYYLQLSQGKNSKTATFTIH